MKTLLGGELAKTLPLPEGEVRFETRGGNREVTWAQSAAGFNASETEGMLYALVFLVVAIIAGLLGFGAIAFAAAGIAKLLFFIFLILFLVSLITHLRRGPRV